MVSCRVHRAIDGEIETQLYGVRAPVCCVLVQRCLREGVFWKRGWEIALEETSHSSVSVISFRLEICHLRAV